MFDPKNEEAKFEESRFNLEDSIYDDPAKWAIRFDQLMKFQDEAKQTFGPRLYKSVTMRDICEKILIPMCSSSGTSVALAMNPGGLQVEAFVTHCWDEPFYDFVESIKAAFSTAFKKPNLWICAFAIVQGHEETVAKQLGKSLQDAPFVKALQSAQQFVVVRNVKVDLYTRIWCICELMYAKDFSLIPDKGYVVGRSPPGLSGAMTTCLEAEAYSENDKRRILDALRNRQSVEEIDNLIDELRAFPSSSEQSRRNKILLVLLGILTLAFGAVAITLGFTLTTRNGSSPVTSLQPPINIATNTFAPLNASLNSATALIWSQLGRDLSGTHCSEFACREIDVYFGASVALSGDGKIVAAGSGNRGTPSPFNDDDEVYYEEAYVTTFEYVEDSAWVMVPLQLPENQSSFYRPVSLSGDGSTLAVGGPVESGIGAVNVYRLVVDGTSKKSWELLGTTIFGVAEPDDDDNDDQALPSPPRDGLFGWSLSLSNEGQVLAVGAPAYYASFWNETTGDDRVFQGQVKVFSYSSVLQDWVQLGDDINDGSKGYDLDRLGWALQLSGDGLSLVVSAPHSEWPNDESGVVFVMRYRNNTWSQYGQAIAGDGRHFTFGKSVAISRDGTTIAAGSDLDFDGGDGYARIFRFISGQWVQLGQRIDGVLYRSKLGTSIALSGDGNTVVIGAPGSLGYGYGHVHVYALAGSTWEKVGNSILGETPGASVSISTNGTIVVVGDQSEDRTSGQVRVYQIAEQEPDAFPGETLPPSIPIRTYDASTTEIYDLPDGRQTSMPSEFGLLTALTRLSLNQGDVSGTLPSELGRLSTLMFLELSGRALTGWLPTELGQLTSLQNLTIDFNKLTGRLPSELGLLSELAVLNLCQNLLTGRLPSEFYLLTSLHKLSLGRNALTGNIKTHLGLLTALSDLDLESSSFFGSIPSELGLLTELTTLNIRHNSMLTGSIFSELGLLTKLTDLGLVGTKLVGTIPTQVGLMTALYGIYLYDSNFSGLIPSELGMLTDLEWLSLYNSSFSGLLPESVCTLAQTSLGACYVDVGKVLVPDNCPCICPDRADGCV